ncbi:Predicted kinase, aminoglycoside phosphotransferase (APT) family [Andreprevotia lacus DSM 23236]|jgi:aminoglycoside phosphotransferase (APT) family kinase protein|uniref:Predicted kinase, aminoglycoside phosphotransferase (APT) family n=1 Tax=Andreprevotia lacus DSM 23236 TaxID=1121001 RepID=A0A1W1XAW3_9NEIS|nr:phosphotransferase [Andreprevotia lacus]SMC21076.1 Predicted kinase, aminoglycoside phosphotransferase (APT) family [Andreprevotia lacus DSM 23236]
MPELDPPIFDWLHQRALVWFGERPVVQQVFNGFYGQVCIVQLADSTLRVVKRFRIHGFAEREYRATRLLRSMTPAHIAVPDILHFEPAAVGGWDAFVMSHIAGVNACDTPLEHADGLIADIVALQQHWHAQGSRMFQDLLGNEYPTFAASYRADLEARCDFLRSADGFDAAQKAALFATLDDLDPLLAPLADDAPCFIHDDGHAANYMVDPQSWRLNAVIDPAGARYAHRELDLFHLPDARADFNLLDHYLAQNPCAPGWEARRYLFSLWDDIKHAELTGWRDSAWFERKLAAYAVARGACALLEK